LADGGASEEAWPAAASAIEILFWEDRFADAGDLAERLIERLAGTGSALDKQDLPFDSALLAAQVHAGVPAGPRLVRLAGVLPAGSVLGDAFTWLAHRLPGLPAERLLVGYRGWDDPAGTVDDRTAALADREYAQLTEPERRVLWNGLVSANAFPAARQVFERSGQAPPTWDAGAWLAGWYASTGALRTASGLLIAAHGTWWPYAFWDCVPIAPVLQPVLRAAVTPEIREYYLTTATGPEAKDGS
jgi:hypothetical protein